MAIDFTEKENNFDSKSYYIDNSLNFRRYSFYILKMVHLAQSKK